MRFERNQESQRQTKNFYFQEIDIIIVFSNCGNKGNKPAWRINGSGEVLDSQEIDCNYPHTVGYYKDSTGQGASFKPEY
jgi:hypothetical protein